MNLFGNTAEENSSSQPTLEEMLNQATPTQKPTTKTSKVPYLQITPEEMELVDRFQAANRNKKQAEAEMTRCAPALLQKVRDQIDADGYAGNYHNSYKLQGNKEVVTVTYKNAWTINPSDAERLKVILGENYPQLIIKKYVVRLKDDVFTNPEKANELMALIGNRFLEFFEKEEKLAVCENFDSQLYRVVPRDKLPTLRQWARQYKGQIR